MTSRQGTVAEKVSLKNHQKSIYLKGFLCFRGEFKVGLTEINRRYHYLLDIRNLVDRNPFPFNWIPISWTNRFLRIQVRHRKRLERTCTTRIGAFRSFQLIPIILQNYLLTRNKLKEHDTADECRIYLQSQPPKLLTSTSIPICTSNELWMSSPSLHNSRREPKNKCSLLSILSRKTNSKKSVGIVLL